MEVILHTTIEYKVNNKSLAVYLLKEYLVTSIEYKMRFVNNYEFEN